MMTLYLLFVQYEVEILYSMHFVTGGKLLPLLDWLLHVISKLNFYLHTQRRKKTFCLFV